MKSKDFTPFQAGGVKAAGVKYQFLRSEDDKLVLAKKKECGAISIQCSKTGNPNVIHWGVLCIMVILSYSG